MRKILEIKAGYHINLEKYGLNKPKIRTLWTIYDEEMMWNNSLKKNLETLKLKHHQGVFFEERTHDWDIHDNELSYYSRIVKQGELVKILIEYE